MSYKFMLSSLSNPPIINFTHTKTKKLTRQPNRQQMFPSCIPQLLLITLFICLTQFALANGKIKMLVISPASQLNAKNYTWHLELAKIFAKDQNVESVLLLGLVESEDEEEPKKVEGKLTTWKRMRCGHEKPDCGKKVDSANPIQKLWQQFKDFVMKSGDPGNTHYLDILMYNDQLIEELRTMNFNLGCIEGIGLEGLQQGILYMLGIPHTCLTSSTIPDLAIWQMLGFTEIVKHVPGQNLAKIGDHLNVVKEKNGKSELEMKAIADRKSTAEMNAIAAKNAITLKNEEFIKSHADVSERTLKSWKKELTKKYRKERKYGLVTLVENLPTMEGMFKKTSLLFVNYQPMLDYPLIETEMGRNVEHPKPKLLYVGGAGMNEAETVVAKKKEAIKAEEQVEEAQRKVQLVEDSLAIKHILKEVFAVFEHSLQFIWKYGNNPADGPYQEITVNVRAKKRLPQKELLGQSEVRAFISHCGLESVIKAVKSGIPLICIPFNLDQLNNAERLASRGVAVVIDIQRHDDQQHKGESGTQGHGATTEETHDKEKEKQYEREARKEAEARITAALTVELSTLSKPQNIYAKNMAELQKRFNQLQPTKAIHDSLTALHAELFGESHSHSDTPRESHHQHAADGEGI